MVKEKINWGIIGCGDVAEVKSGPAFQKIPNSTLLAVMRRNSTKAKDFADRHKVPIWSNRAEELIENKEIDALYIATPPSTHLAYTIKALDAGKHVYLEKPMAMGSEEARRISDAVERSNSKLTVAHYRRMLPAFLKIKELVEDQAVGNILHVDLQILQPKKSDIIAITEENWRLDPKVSGGGYFYDIAPHQIDLMYHFFGAFDKVTGFSTCERGQELVEDIVNGIIAFKNGIQFRGIWNFNAPQESQTDSCTIYGTKGSIAFSFFGDRVNLFRYGNREEFTFKNPKHVQQPMITAVVDYFLGKGGNPCTAKDGLLIMEALEKLSGRQ